jgi:hypothetical protein
MTVSLHCRFKWLIYRLEFAAAPPATARNYSTKYGAIKRLADEASVGACHDITGCFVVIAFFRQIGGFLE